MTSRRGGSEGYKSPPSPPSSGSEDNGFTNRPRVAGLYVKNLSREELDELAKEGIYGPTGNPNDRPRDGGSQRSLNILGSSRDLDSQDHFRGATSRTPQPPRRSGIAVKHREPDGRLSETLARKDHHGLLPTERGWSRRPEDHPGQTLSERSARGSSEFPIGWRESLRPSVSASPRESSIDVRITDEDLRMAAGQRHFREAPKRPEVPSRRVISSTGPSEDQGQSPPPYAGLSPPKYTEYEEPSSRASKICPKTATRVYQADDKEHTSSPYECPSSPSLKEDKESLFPQTNAKSSDSRVDTDKADEVTSPSGTEKLTSPESKKSESPPMKRIGSRTQDSMRLRPPLAGTAGTSADSGTGDSGSAEIQADVVTPQTASSDILDTKESKIESRSFGARTPGSKGGKQTVKPFTKESRLENKTIQLVREYGFQPKKKMSVEDGAILPNKFEPFPNNLYGRPLEEIDNFIYDETFCVVSKRFRKNYIHRFAATNSWFIFSPWNPIRRCCIFLSTNQYFDYVVMATILLNCVFLAMTETFDDAELIFLAIYTAEMVIKSIAKGFILNKYTYLRNPWNWLDFVVITSGYATIGMAVGNLAGLRTFRVLRALKTVSIMPGLKTIINALLHSFKQLAEVMTLTIFCLMVFALFALQVYMGELRNKCVKQQEPNTTQIDWRESSRKKEQIFD